MSYTSGRATITQYMISVISEIPEVAALGPGHVWGQQAPADAEGIIIVVQQIGPGLGVAPIGGAVIAANYRFQWRVGHAKDSMVGLIPIAKAIQERFNNARNDTTPTGEQVSMMVDVTDLPPVPVDDSGRPMQELGGEVKVFVNFGVSP